MNDVDTTPDPGTQEAQDQGCRCPVLDNRGATPGTFVYDMACPLHARREEPAPKLVNAAMERLNMPGIPRWVIEETLRAVLDPREPERLYTKSEVGDAQASEAELVTQHLQKELRELKRQNDALKDAFLASRLHDVIKQAGIDAVARTYPCY